ncbi:DUF559 domain-containing protein [Corynebacterium atrinae]
MINKRNMAISDTEFWESLASYKFLTAEVAMPRSSYDELAPWVRPTVQAAAVGMSVDTAVVAGRAAARLWGIALHNWRDPTVDLLYTDDKRPGGRSTWPAGWVYHSAHLSPDDVRELRGVRVTSVMRTLRDIASWNGELEGVVATDSARAKWSELTKATLRRHMLPSPRFAGKASVERVIELSDEKSGSPLESHARFLLVEANLEGVVSIETQAKVTDPATGQNFLLDLLINNWIAVEIDGQVKYDGVSFGATEDVIRRERQREKTIQNMGLVMIRTSKPEEVVELVARALARVMPSLKRA